MATATLLKRRRVLAVKAETVPGTAVALTATEAIFCFDPVIQGDIQMTERVHASSLSKLTSISGTRAGSITFTVEASGGSTNAIATLLTGCGFANASGVLTPISDVASQTTLTIGLYENGIIKKLAGAMGSAEFNGEDGKPGEWKFTFKGVWVAPSDGAMLTLPAIVTPPRFATATFTIGGKTPKASKVSLNINNTVNLLEDITQASGFYRAIVAEREISGSCDPEADLVANWDVYGIMTANTEAVLSLIVGTTGNQYTIAASKCQLTKVDAGDRNGVITHELSFQCNASAPGGNDEVTVTLS